MYPPKFDYYRASSVSEAVSLMQQHGGKFLAGGHSLIPVMNLRLADPGSLIDIGRLSDLKGISAQGGSIRVGALTTHAMVAASEAVPTAMSEAAGVIGDAQVRNRGTIGGNVAHADPASDMPTVLMALGATFHISGASGDRSVAAGDFFLDLFTTALQEGEILTAIEVPQQGAGTGSAYAKLINPASGYAMVGAAAVLTVQGGQCTAASVAVGGATPYARKAPSVEAALVGKALDANTIAAAAAAVQNDLGDDILTDIHASADYRRSMATVYVKRALTAAAERAGG
jgi:carbon-monoxide dehydrogenase medium subunit